MKSKYYNDAIIGNKNMVATFSSKGELQRLLYPNRDFKQFLDFFTTGVRINDSAFINLHDDINNIYNQYYTDDTNILNTEIENKYFNLKIEQMDFIPIEKDILVKKYKFINNNNITLDTKFFIHSAILSNYNNMVSGRISNEALIQYTKDYSVCTFSNTKLYSYQINNTNENIKQGYIGGKDYIGMSSDSSICYDLGNIKPGESKELVIFIYINDNNEEYSLQKIDEKIKRLKKLQVSIELSSTEIFWKEYLLNHINSNKLKQIAQMGDTEYTKKIEKIYKRTILFFPLLINYKTGGVSASIEVDEKLDFCGRYAYCWTRDAVFITKAFDLLKMEKETEKFYLNFCKKTQRKDGSWEQRFFTDGKLAPCWGYQIDETSSVIYGIYEHYRHTKNIKFLKDTFKMCENAISFLKKYVEDICTGKNEMHESYDIWEMCEGIHAYSLASIYAAFISMMKIYEQISGTYENSKESADKKINELKEYIYKINQYISNNLVDKDRNLILRNNNDNLADVSVIGCIVPFSMFSEKDKKMKNTAEKIEMTLKTYTGGFLRFEGDSYRGGQSPWPITTLWMSMYYKKIGELQKAKEGFDFVINSATKHGLLAEQVDNNLMESNWVIGLGWSHAMFINYLFNM